MKNKVSHILAVITKVLVMLLAFLSVIGGALANFPAASDSMGLPPTWRPYLTTAAFVGIVWKWFAEPLLAKLIEGMKAARAELDKPDDNA